MIVALQEGKEAAVLWDSIGASSSEFVANNSTWGLPLPRNRL